MKKFLTLYLALPAFVSFAQNKTIDSLQQALNNYDAQKLELRKNLLPDESDTVRVNILIGLCIEFYQVSDYAIAKKYADEALAISQSIGNKKGIAKCYSNLGVIYWYQGNYPEALKNHFASLKIKEEIGNKKSIAYSYNNIGNIYWKLSNYPEALKYYYACLKISEETGDKNGIASSYGNIGIIYMEQSNYTEALKNYSASLKINEEVGHKNGIAIAYNNIGNIYTEQGNYPEALRNYFAALKIFKEMGGKNDIASCYANIGTIYDNQSNYPEALKNYFSALKIQEKIEDKSGVATSYINIGTIKLKSQAAKEGMDWLIKALQLAKELQDISALRDVYEGLAQVDSALGNFKVAYENHKLFILYRDSLNNEENTKKITQMQMQYDFDKKEAETKATTDAELKKQKLLRNGFVGGFAVVLLFAGVFFRQRNKTKKEKLRSDEFNNNKCDFKGTIRINQIRKYKQMHFGVDDRLADAGIKAEGLLIGDYEFKEDTTQKHSGIFQGIITVYWYLDKFDILHYDDIALHTSDRYYNNQYVGKWMEYGKSTSMICDWGEWRIPFSGDLDIGAAEFSPNKKYSKKGWNDLEIY